MEVLPDRQHAEDHRECDPLALKVVLFELVLRGRCDHLVHLGTKEEEDHLLGWFGFGWSVVAAVVPGANCSPRIHRTDVGEEFVPDGLSASADRSAGEPTWDEVPCGCWHR